MKIVTAVGLLLLITTTWALHLQQHSLHQALSTTSLNTQITTAIKSLTTLNSSLSLAMASLNPYNQQQRISTLTNSINSARQKLFNLYSASNIPLTQLTYYCQQLTPAQLNNLTTSVNNMQSYINNMSTVPPFSNSLHPYQQTSAQMTTLLTNLKTLTNQTGTPSTGVPVAVSQNNLAGGYNWATGGALPTTVASSYVVGTFQNGHTCPLNSPYATNSNTCLACSGGYFDLNTNTCMPCLYFNNYTQKCGNASSVIPPVNPNAPINPNAPVNPNNPVNPNAPINPNNVTNVSNATVAPAPVQYITNTANPNGLLLPPNTTVTAYQASLPPNGIPCPSVTPYFSGTVCIACKKGQLFSTSTKTCQTCPLNTAYSTTTYQCMKVTYYTNITQNNLWISINKTYPTLLQAMTTTAAIPYSQACPLSTPYYNGSICIACSLKTPFFSFDTNTCINCGTSTAFSPGSHSCVIIQQRQTSLKASNLVLGGIPYNEWLYYHANNQTANPQLANCPPANPYYDGTTCITCPVSAPYFSLTHRLCLNCPPNTSYSASVRQCLSTNGNIVTQNPTLVKMAAGIFA